jgi:hypothetical protein
VIYVEPPLVCGGGFTLSTSNARPQAHAATNPSETSTHLSPSRGASRTSPRHPPGIGSPMSGAHIPSPRKLAISTPPSPKSRCISTSQSLQSSAICVSTDIAQIRSSEREGSHRCHESVLKSGTVGSSGVCPTQCSPGRYRNLRHSVLSLVAKMTQHARRSASKVQHALPAPTPAAWQQLLDHTAQARTLLAVNRNGSAPSTAPTRAARSGGGIGRRTRRQRVVVSSCRDTRQLLLRAGVRIRTRASVLRSACDGELYPVRRCSAALRSWGPPTRKMPGCGDDRQERPG